MTTLSTFRQRFNRFRTARPDIAAQLNDIIPSTIQRSALATASGIVCQSLAHIHQGVLIQVSGVLNRENYLQLMARAQACHAAGARQLVVDLRQVTQIGLAGQFALHNIARLFAGGDLLDPDGGMSELHRALQPLPANIGRQVKLTATPAIAQSLGATSLCQCLDVFEDLDQAVTALQGAGRDVNAR